MTSLQPWKPPRTAITPKAFSSNVAPDSTDHGPMADTLPQGLEAKSIIELEELLLTVEAENYSAQLRASDDRKALLFLRAPGLTFLASLAPLAVAELSPYLLATVGLVGLILFTLGSLSLRGAKREVAITARQFDRDRIIRAIDRKSDSSKE